EAEYEEKVQSIGEPIMRELEKGVMLRQLDTHWKEHLAALDYLRQGIHLRGYAQRNPKQEYKREAFEMFSSMLDRVKADTISILSKIQVRRPEDVQAVERPTSDPATLRAQHAEAPSLVAPPPPQPGAPLGAPRPRAAMGVAAGAGGNPHPSAAAAARMSSEPATPYVREDRKVGRNEPCPCGSGKKYKQCHGRLE